MRSSGLGRNFLFTITGMMVPVAISLITIPLYIHHLGESRYGVLTIIWLLLGYFGFLDMGLSRASANALAKLRDGKADERALVLASSLSLNLGLGIVGGALIYFAGGYAFRSHFDLTPEIWAELSGVMIWVAAMLPVALLSGVAIGALEAQEKFLSVNILQTVGSAAGQIVPALCAVYLAPDLSLIIPVAFAVRLISGLAVFSHLLRSERLPFYRFDSQWARNLLRYGAWVSVTNIVGPVLTSLDQFLVGMKLGTAAVTHYSVPMNLTSRIQIIAVALSRVVFPRLSAYERDAAIELAEKAVVALAYLFGAACIGALFLIGPFLALWISPEFAEITTPIAQTLMIGTWINGLAFISLSLLQGQGRPDLAAKMHLLELLPFIAILWLMIQQFGLPGAAAAWVLRVAVDALLLFHLSGLRVRRLLTVLPAGLAILAVQAIVMSQLVLSLPVAVACAVAAAGLLLLLGIAIDPTVRAFTRRVVASSLRRGK